MSVYRHGGSFCDIICIIQGGVFVMDDERSKRVEEIISILEDLKDELYGMAEEIDDELDDIEDEVEQDELADQMDCLDSAADDLVNIVLTLEDFFL